MSALSKTGARQLAECEATIASGLGAFQAVGDALTRIREGRLYRQNFATFEDYCASKWGFSARRANQLMSAAEIGTMVPVLNERQARAFAPLKGDPFAILQAWKLALDRDDTTAAGIGIVVMEMTATPATAEDAPLANEDGEPIAEDEATPSSSASSEGGSAGPSVGTTPALPPPAPSDEDGGESGAGEVVPNESTPPPSSSVPPIDPALGYRARATAERSKARDGLLTLDPARVMQTTDDPKAWLDFIEDGHKWLSDLRHEIEDTPKFRVIAGGQ